MDDKKAEKNILTQKGLKLTNQRKLIMDVLQNKSHPISAEDIFFAVKTNCPAISLSTIYRNLEKMADSKIINKVIFDDGIARYELLKNDHSHKLVCMGCNATVNIDRCPIKELQKNISNEMDFDITSHKVELYGYCSKCKNINA